MKKGQVLGPISARGFPGKAKTSWKLELSMGACLLKEHLHYPESVPSCPPRPCSSHQPEPGLFHPACNTEGFLESPTRWQGWLSAAALQAEAAGTGK